MCEESHQVKGPCKMKIGLFLLLDSGDIIFIPILLGILLLFALCTWQLNAPCPLVAHFHV